MAHQHPTSNIDPAIFQSLQAKIDEEGRIRDVTFSFLATAELTDPGTQRHNPEPGEARWLSPYSSVIAAYDI